jgi:phage terminase large subunit-like protein
VTLSNLSLAEVIAELSEEEQQTYLQALSEEEADALAYDWNFWGRPEQHAPDGDWSIWLLLAGRGFGKTRTGSEWIRSQVCGKTPLDKGIAGRVAIIGETAADCRDVLVEGQSGILATHAKEFRPTYEVTKRRLTWPNGATATLYNATEPDQLRGPQHEIALCDELAKWRYADETWDMLQFGLRLGTNPRTAITTTPRPIPLIKAITALPGTIVTRGSTLDNRSNLAPKFIKNIFDRYDGTRLGRQELYGEVVDDVPGALWERAGFDANRVKLDGKLPAMRRVIVAIDPAAKQSVAADETSETGIVVVGLGVDGLGYVIDDVSCREGPTGWAKRATAVYNYYEADAFVAEINQGGDMVEAVMRTEAPAAKIIKVRASKGKVTRAEPISALYTRNRIKHVGNLPLLEDQMVLFTPFGILGSGAADRVDALVWGLTELFPRFISIDGMTARGNKELKHNRGRYRRQRTGANRSTGY